MTTDAPQKLFLDSTLFWPLDVNSRNPTSVTAGETRERGRQRREEREGKRLVLIQFHAFSEDLRLGSSAQVATANITITLDSSLLRNFQHLSHRELRFYQNSINKS